MAVVFLSVCFVPDHKSRREGHSKLKIGRTENHNTGDPRPHLEFKKGHQAALGGCSSHHLQGAGNIQAGQLVSICRLAAVFLASFDGLRPFQ